MRQLKKILKEQYYIEAPDQLNQIRSQVELKSSKTSIYQELKSKNFYLKLTTVFSVVIVVLLGMLVINNYFSNQNYMAELDSKQEIVNSIFRDRVKEENIENIEQVGRLLPLDDEEIVHFVMVFSELEFKKPHSGPDLENREYFEYIITFKDDSNFSVTFYENNYIKIVLNKQVYYFYEANSYNKIMYHPLGICYTKGCFYLNINKALNFISENNISPQEVFKLVEKVKNLDLSNEANIRSVIRDVSKLAGKPIDKNKENYIVKEIMKNGISDNLFNYL